MDAYEATKVVMSRIQCLDPDNASKIMGYILIQDRGEKEVIRLAFSPESLLLSYINQAKVCLGLSSTTNPVRPPPPPPPGSPLPPRLMIPNGNNNGILLNSNNNPSSLSPSPGFQAAPRPFSYAAALNGSHSAGDAGNGAVSPNFQFYGGAEHHQIQDQLPFMEESAPDPVMSPSGRSDSIFFHYGDEDLNSSSISSSPVSYPFHRRSCSVNDAAFLSNLEDGGSVGGFGWRPPCMYFAKGHCKNGSSCKFIHSDAIEIGSANGFDELFRMKALEQQRIAALMGMGHHHHHHHHHPFGYSKCVDFLNENPRPNAAADEFRKYGFNRAVDRNEFSPVGLFSGGANSSSRQIYLTFPADSTFKEEDVSNYFSTFGPVQDVRIPYQQKRMFGFVTFHFPETVNLILAKGNPHFVCDSRVLVKPYKEKGKIQEKKQQQQLHDQNPSGDHVDLPFGPRVLLSSQEMILRRKLEEEAELQHAIELQSRRMMNLHLMDLKNQQQQQHRGGNHQLLMNPNFTTASSTQTPPFSDFAVSPRAVKSSADQNAEFPESLEHVLPDNLFAASPTDVEESDDNNNKHTASPNSMATPKFKCQAIDI